MSNLGGVWWIFWPEAAVVHGLFWVLAGACAFLASAAAMAFVWIPVSLAVEAVTYAVKNPSCRIVRTAAFFTSFVYSVDLFFLPFFPSLTLSSSGRTAFYFLPSLLVAADCWGVSMLRRAAEGATAGGAKVKVKKVRVPKSTVKKPSSRDEQLAKETEVEQLTRKVEGLLQCIEDWSEELKAASRELIAAKERAKKGEAAA